MLRYKLLPYKLFALLCLLLQPFFAFAATRRVTLAWDASPDPAVIGYRVHWGTSSGVYDLDLDVGSNTFATISGLTPGTDFFFVVTAYSTAPVESAPTDELFYRTSPLIYPTVAIASPISGVQINGPTSVELDTQTSDPDSILSRIEFFNGAQKLGETAVAPFKLVSDKLAPGVYSISAVAVAQDGTRSSSNLITVEIVPLRVGSSRFRADGNFELTVSGAIGSTNRVWYSDDLITWHVLSTVTNTGGEVSIVDPDAKNVSKRFYKVSSP